MTDSEADGMFKISRDDGVISIASDIDREVTNDIVTLTVKVLFVYFNTVSGINIL